MRDLGTDSTLHVIVAFSPKKNIDLLQRSNDELYTVFIMIKRKYIHIVLSEDINIFVFYERCLHVHVIVFIQETEEIIGNRLDLC